MKETTKHLDGKYTDATYLLITSCSDEELRLYLYLKLYALYKNNAFPGTRKIANDLGWGTQKVKTTIKKMEKDNRLQILRRNNGKGGRGATNVYNIIWYDELNIKGRRNKEGDNHLVNEIKGVITTPELTNITLSKDKDNIQTDSLKTEKYPEQWYDETFKFYESLVEKREGYKPRCNYGQAKVQIKLLFHDKYTVEKIKGLLEFYVLDEKFNKIGAAITNALTPHTINLWMQKGSPKSSYQFNTSKECLQK
jgi:hypothetical protein